MAMSRASTTSSARRWLAIAQPTTRREKQSSTTARYSQPDQVGTSVMSATTAAGGHGPAGPLHHHGGCALPARHGGSGCRHRPGAEPADRGRLSGYGTEMARGTASASLPMREAGRWTRPGLLVWDGAPAGIEPATPSLPWNHQEPLCGTPFPQVTPDRRGQSYRPSFGEVMRSLSSQMLIIPGASHHPRRAHERGADCTDWLSAHVAVRETDLAAAIRQGRNRAATPRSRPAPPPRDRAWPAA